MSKGDCFSIALFLFASSRAASSAATPRARVCVATKVNPGPLAALRKSASLAGSTGAADRTAQRGMTP